MQVLRINILCFTKFTVMLKLTKSKDYFVVDHLVSSSNHAIIMARNIVNNNIDQFKINKGKE